MLEAVFYLVLKDTYVVSIFVLSKEQGVLYWAYKHGEEWSRCKSIKECEEWSRKRGLFLLDRFNGCIEPIPCTKSHLNKLKKLSSECTY